MKDEQTILNDCEQGDLTQRLFMSLENRIIKPQHFVSNMPLTHNGFYFIPRLSGAGFKVHERLKRVV